MEFALSSAIAAVLILVYLGMLSIAWRHRQRAGLAIIRWLIIMLGLVIAQEGLSAVSSDTELIDNLTQRALVTYLLSLMLIVYAVLSMIYLQQPKASRWWLAAGSLWWVALMLLDRFGDAPRLGSESWLTSLVEEPDPASVLAVGGWIVIGALLLVIALYKFYAAGLPEVANRALFWAAAIPLVIMGAVVGTSGTSPVREVGGIVQVIGVGCVVYGVLTLRVVDVRHTLRVVAVNGLLVLITTAAISVALFIADAAEPDINTSRTVLLIGLALVTAFLYAPFYLAAQTMAGRLTKQGTDDVAQEMRRLAEAITGVVEMDELTNVILQTLRSVLRVRRGGLILVTSGEQNLLNVEPYRLGLGEMPTIQSSLAIDGPVYNTLVKGRRPLLQFDLDFSPEYTEVSPSERDFFRQMRMAAYAPVVVQARLISILACGPKANDAPFSPNDLELLAALANQTGIALRNARLVDDLRKREHDVAETNKRLEATKRQLEALDAVKTDFITIASHELRTPLAQIRGHTDIIEALNEQALLDQEQLGSLTQNLRKAADRLEGLIGDMLDVSQLYLSAMDLRFAQTTIENVVRLAIEPLQESIRNRKQSLTARGLRGLPPIDADMQRLVQAFRNIVLNAVKFTPDGGRIDIIGSLISNSRTGQDEIQIVIRDTGIGIDPKNQEAIFEKFFRTTDPSLHSTGSTKFMGAGPGLGLTIARGVITGHGGRIRVESEGYDPAKMPGSTFYVILPLHPPEGVRRVMPFGSPGSSPTRPAPPVGTPPSAKEAPQPVTPEKAVKQAELPPEPEEAEPFEEPNPTLINPAASRFGVTAAAKAAAEEALTDAESGAPPSDSKGDSQERREG